MIFFWGKFFKSFFFLKAGWLWWWWSVVHKRIKEHQQQKQREKKNWIFNFAIIRIKFNSELGILNSDSFELICGIGFATNWDFSSWFRSWWWLLRRFILVFLRIRSKFQFCIVKRWGSWASSETHSVVLRPANA